MIRLATLIAALLLALPGTVLAQGAGDDQYQDPFGDESAQGGGSPSQGGGLSDAPPVTGGGGAGAAGGGGSGAAGATSSGAGSRQDAAPSAPAPAPAQAGRLPETGAEPLVVLLWGVALVLTGLGLRLRTARPDPR